MVRNNLVYLYAISCYTFTQYPGIPVRLSWYTCTQFPVIHVHNVLFYMYKMTWDSCTQYPVIPVRNICDCEYMWGNLMSLLSLVDLNNFLTVDR